MSAEEFVPARKTLPSLTAAVQDCRGCPLWEHATQAVFGEGAKDARMVLVGEQPGDAEDREGAPFVGPAGRILDAALEEADIPREELYVTNAVKHFKWQPRGKRRIHQSPNRTEVGACRPWLDAELDLLQPSVVVALGAVAAQSLFGPKFRVTKQRGEIQELGDGGAPLGVATIHPASVVRQREDADRRRELAGLTKDLAAAWELARSESAEV